MSKKIFVSLSGISAFLLSNENGLEQVCRAENADVVIAENTEGVQLCRKIRETDGVTGVILLFDKEDELADGYSAGADECVLKPVDAQLLAAKVCALYRRVSMCRRTDEKTTVCGEYILDHKRHALIKEDRITELTQIEYCILEFFFSIPDVPAQRSQILSYVWGGNYYGEEKVVDVNIRRIRMKVEKDPSSPEHLVTVRGRGYMWKT
ncbi:MAG: response regulator transcription factor [Clostridia bacterium]|nr:response regulator transcription factor [Clostridia bacterium]